MANPTLLDMPIARDGNKNTIPATDNGTTGLLSQQYGWQLINAIPPQQGGKAVKREDFNGALYLLSNLLFYLQKGWQFEWDANQNYYAGCIVKDPNNGKMYQRLNDGTSNTAPHSDTTNWKLWDLSMLANYLPLSGGAMTGDSIERSVSNRLLTLSSRTSGHAGAYLMVFGGEDNEVDMTRNGVFQFVAQKKVNGTVSVSTMTGQPSGELEWNGNDLGGSAIVAKSFNAANGYVKNASGEIRQWGNTAGINAGDTTQVTFPISFKGTTKFGLGTSLANNGNTEPTAITQYEVYDVTFSGFKIKAFSYIPYGIHWQAIGY